MQATALPTVNWNKGTPVKGASQAPDIFYLDKIFSIKKQLQVFDILQAIHPTHEERLWMVGFLKYMGYTCEEVIQIIDQHSDWTRYDPEITRYQVGTVFNNHRVPGARSSPNTKRRKRKWDLSPAEVWRINLSRTSQMDRKLTEFLKENDIPLYECPHCKSLPFKPETLLRGGL